MVLSETEKHAVEAMIGRAFTVDATCNCHAIPTRHLTSSFFVHKPSRANCMDVSSNQ